MNKQTIQWLHEAWRTLTTITRDYMCYFIPKNLRHFPRIEKNPAPYLISELYTNAALVVWVHTHTAPTPLLFRSYIFSTWHKLKLQYEQYTFSTSLTAEFSRWKFDVNLRCSVCHLLHVLCHSLFIACCWGFDKLQLVICSYRDWCYL